MLIGLWFKIQLLSIILGIYVFFSTRLAVGDVLGLVAVTYIIDYFRGVPTTALQITTTLVLYSALRYLGIFKR